MNRKLPIALVLAAIIISWGGRYTGEAKLAVLDRWTGEVSIQSGFTDIADESERELIDATKQARRRSNLVSVVAGGVGVCLLGFLLFPERNRKKSEQTSEKNI